MDWQQIHPARAEESESQPPLFKVWQLGDQLIAAGGRSGRLLVSGDAGLLLSTQLGQGPPVAQRRRGRHGLRAR